MLHCGSNSLRDLAILELYNDGATAPHPLAAGKIDPAAFGAGGDAEIDSNECLSTRGLRDN
jgi:hypothetical protein